MSDRVFLKDQSKKILSETTPSPYGTTLIYLIINWIVNYIIGRLYQPISVWTQNAAQYYYKLGYVPAVETIIFPSYLFILALNILMQVIAVGYMSCTLKISRKIAITTGNLGDGFYRFWKITGIYILTGIFTFLWSLLFIIPGIVALYRYRLAYYIALEHPELGPLQCIRESKRLMTGYKFDLFILDLSFLGWYLLGMLTFGIVFIWKLPYIMTTYALFYQELAYPQSPPVTFI